ncbi:integrase core domain-containing protein [Roseiarcus sp.]|uniref:integrase core domain-containing protein n=1 Tax=Roseiarcus sp. TaxID=1969460 RepID=UPI003C7330DD
MLAPSATTSAALADRQRAIIANATRSHRIAASQLSTFRAYSLGKRASTVGRRGRFAQARRFRTFQRLYNEERPHQALGNATPAEHGRPDGVRLVQEQRAPLVEWPSRHAFERMRRPHITDPSWAIFPACFRSLRPPDIALITAN